MRARINTILLIVTSVLPSLGQAQGKNPTMSGVVTDRQSRLPVAGARVTVIGNRATDTTTDSDGSFIVTLTQGVEEGSTVRIRVEKSGYRPYEKLLPVSSTVPLQVSLLAIKTAAPSGPAPVQPISKADSFSTLVPFHGEWKNSPIPMNSNLSDPHEEFYSGLVELAGRPDKPPEGRPAYTERKFESLDEQFKFVTRLIQFYVFRSIYSLQRGVAGGIKWTAGIGVTPINIKPIVPPDVAPYPTMLILDALTGSEFLNPVDEMLWKSRPLTMPIGTRVSFLEHANPEKGEVFTCVVRLERPGYFRVDFEVQAGPGMNNQLPAGFSTQAIQGTTTYTISVAMKYEVQRRRDRGFQPDEYAAWADSLFEGLKKQIGFEAPAQASQPKLAPESSLAIDASADIADYPPGVALGTIHWKDEYTHVQLNVTNQEPDDLSDVDLVVGMDTQIAAVAQKTNFPDIVWFPPLADPVLSASVTTIDKDGNRVVIPAIPMGITTAPAYRIRFNKIFSHSTVQFIIASVVFNMTPGVDLHSPYAPKRLPNWLDVKGSYRIGQVQFIVDRHLAFRLQ